LRAKFDLRKGSVKIGFELNSQYYKSHDIYWRISREAFPRINQRNETTIFAIKLTASNFQFMAEVPTPQRGICAITMATTARVPDLISSVCYLAEALPPTHYNNLYVSDDNENFENWCEEYYDSYQY
jgi:hypothetical protein